MLNLLICLGQQGDHGLAHAGGLTNQDAVFRIEAAAGPDVPRAPAAVPRPAAPTTGTASAPRSAGAFADAMQDATVAAVRVSQDGWAKHAQIGANYKRLFGRKIGTDFGRFASDLQGPRGGTPLQWVAVLARACLRSPPHPPRGELAAEPGADRAVA